MLTHEENELLSRVGPGTPCGELMRRYWHPIAPAVQLDEDSVRNVRILGENLVLYRDRSGTLGLIGDRCPHRSMHMEWGVPEDAGLRCPYHGWLFDEHGLCTEMPLEPPGSAFKEKVSITAYPVEMMGGLIWAYLGPLPAPLLPQWDLCVRDDGFREIVGHQLPCNWLQCQENRGDLGHGIYLHGRLYQYALEKEGMLTEDPNVSWNATMRRQSEKLKRGVYTMWQPVYNELGFSKGQRDSDQGEDSPSWTIGTNPILFPYHLAFGPNPSLRMRRWYQIGVPIDDYNTWHITYMCYTFPPEVGVPDQQTVPYTELPLRDENGKAILDYILAQDMVAWWSQGEFVDRRKERLGTSDSCVIAYRKMLREQIEIVRNGGEPMNVFWDAEKAHKPELRIPCMQDSDAISGSYRTVNRTTDPDAPSARPRSTDYFTISADDQFGFVAHPDKFLQTKDTLQDLFRKADELWAQRRREDLAAQPSG